MYIPMIPLEALSKLIIACEVDKLELMVKPI